MMTVDKKNKGNQAQGSIYMAIATSVLGA
jgi:hypothetical protein